MFLAGAPTASALTPAKIISGVSVSPSFFNPTVGQRERISLTLERQGTLHVEVLDRDQFVVRTMTAEAAQPGAVSLYWDGRDDSGSIVPDEAYTCKIIFTGEGARDVFDPYASYHPATQDLSSCTYSRADGVLGYAVPWPARVRIQAGQATKDPATGAMSGPVLKTVVDSKPRAGGAIVESWNGFDEGGTIYVPDLPHFVVGLTITPLPASACITVGNRKTTFLDYARSHRPKGELTPRAHDVKLSEGRPPLNGIEDQSPLLRMQPTGPVDPVTKIQSLRRAAADLTIALDGWQAQYFLTSSSELNLFVDEKLVFRGHARRASQHVKLGPESLPAGEHRIVANWTSGLGPLGVNAIRVRVAEPSPPAQPAQHRGEKSSDKSP